MPHVLGKVVSSVLQAYYLGPDHPMKLRLWDGLRRFLDYPRLTIPYAQCGWITVDERDLVARYVFVTGTYEPEVWDALGTFAIANEVVWDVGAHIGTLTIKALLDSRVHEVHAFEPNPTNADILTLNLGLNRGCYKIHRLALSSQVERRSLHLAPISNTGLGSFTRRFSNMTCLVDCKTVDDLVFKDGVTPPTLMKVDVEDWEFHVFYGAQRLLAESPPKAIVFEAACDTEGQMTDANLIVLLQDLGYTISRILRPSGIVELRENYLAVHSSVTPQADAHLHTLTMRLEHRQ